MDFDHEIDCPCMDCEEQENREALIKKIYSMYEKIGIVINNEQEMDIGQLFRLQSVLRDCSNSVKRVCYW